jgi:hypothetical protein
VICTTNAIESINARLRRAVNARGHFPTEQAAQLPGRAGACAQASSAAGWAARWPITQAASVSRSISSSASSGSMKIPWSARVTGILVIASLSPAGAAHMAVTGIRPGHFPSKAASASRQPWVTAPSIRCPGALRWLFGFAAWACRCRGRRRVSVSLPPARAPSCPQPIRDVHHDHHGDIHAAHRDTVSITPPP